MSLHALVNEKGIVVCCGSGGVGKTTTAAAIAVEAARRGRRACVVTIDPAKRLADALGLETLHNTPSRVETDDSWPGELWALMLDTKSTFDALITRYAASPEQGERILQNRMYRNIAGALSGTQEYMAMEKLYELHDSGQFDLIVIDTPPTRNALDFLDAPRRLTRFLDNRLFRIVVMPTRAYLKAVSVATQAFLRAVTRVVGNAVVSDVIAFFQAFEGMEAGFRTRAQAVLELLSDPGTAFVLVTSPRRDAIEEAEFFASRLRESGIDVDALIVNRVHPTFEVEKSGARERAHTLAGTPLGPLYENLADFSEIAEREERNYAVLSAKVADAGAVVRVPFLADDVHDVGGLVQVADYLVA
jgi:anion-transporting  ArsA/GET3 family ATPase